MGERGNLARGTDGRRAFRRAFSGIVTFAEAQRLAGAALSRRRRVR